MDNSPEYLEMVMKAHDLSTMAEKGEILLDEHSVWTDANIWLPRVDQLAVLFQNTGLQFINVAFLKGKIISNIYPVKKLQEWASWEQLFICVAMLCKFKKYWDFKEKDWIPVPPPSKIITADQIIAP